MLSVSRSLRRSYIRVAVLLFAVVAMVVPAQANATPDAEAAPSGAGGQSAAQPLDPVEEAADLVEEPVAPGEVSTFDVQTRASRTVSVKVTLPPGTNPQWLDNAYARVMPTHTPMPGYSVPKKINPSTGQVTITGIPSGKVRVTAEFEKDFILNGEPYSESVLWVLAPGTTDPLGGQIFDLSLYPETNVVIDVPKSAIDEFYFYPNGVPSADGTGRWYKIRAWIFADNNDNIRSGWHKVDGYWHWTTENAWVATGWWRINGTWYFFDYESTRMVTGWHHESVGEYVGWYYHYSDGSMATGWVKDGGSWYYLHPSSGAMATGWVKDGSSWYYLNPSSGAMTTGWAWINGSWYYFRSSGAMATGWVQIGGVWFFFNASGAWVP